MIKPYIIASLICLGVDTGLQQCLPPPPGDKDGDMVERNRSYYANSTQDITSCNLRTPNSYSLTQSANTIGKSCTFFP